MSVTVRQVAEDFHLKAVYKPAALRALRVAAQQGLLYHNTNVLECGNLVDALTACGWNPTVSDLSGDITKLERNPDFPNCMEDMDPPLTAIGEFVERDSYILVVADEELVAYAFEDGKCNIRYNADVFKVYRRPLQRIQNLLSGTEWSADTTQAIAEVLRSEGFEVEDLDEEPADVGA